MLFQLTSLAETQPEKVLNQKIIQKTKTLFLSRTNFSAKLFFFRLGLRQSGIGDGFWHGNLKRGPFLRGRSLLCSPQVISEQNPFRK